MYRLHALVAVSMVAATITTPTSAATVIKFDLGQSNPPADVRFDGSSLFSIDDLGGSTAGDQDTGLVFLGPLGGQPNVNSGASLTLQGIVSDGAATLLGSTVLQTTSGGQLSIYDANNSLLLSGAIGGGLITGDTGSPTGGFMSTSPIQWTGGSLTGLMGDGSLSLSFDDVMSSGGAGMAVSGDRALAPFSAIATGQVGTSGVTAVPEPSSLAGIAIALLGGITLTRRGRRSVATLRTGTLRTGMLRTGTLRTGTLRKCAIALGAIACLAGGSAPASAGTILKVNFGNSGPDFEFDGSVVGTPDDLDSGTTGLQNSQVTFAGDFDSSYADILSGGSLSIFGIGLDGPASATAGGVITQSTLGGGFSIFDASNSLLLAGTIHEGMIVGMSGVSGASFTSTSPIDYTGGWLFPQIEPPTGTLSVALGTVPSGNQTGLQVRDGKLIPFTAGATGSFGGMVHSTPEPGSGIIFATMAIGLGVWGHRRRRRFLAGRNPVGVDRSNGSPATQG